MSRFSSGLRATRRRVLKALGVGAGVGAAVGVGAPATAQTAQAALSTADSFPDRPIRLVLLFPAGNGIDTTSRFFADLLSKEIGQTVVVDNKPGGNGVIALQSVKTSPADGYTVLISSSSPTTIATAFGKKLPYDPFKDFKPLIGYIRAIGLLTVAGDSKITSLPDLMANAKESGRPTLVGTYADAYYLTSQRLANLASVRFENVPYKGQTNMLQDLIGRQLDVAYGDAQTPREMVNAGRLRAIAVTGSTRSVAYPSVPTVAESGFPDFTYYSWNAFFVRTETPKPIADKLYAALQRVLKGAEFNDYVRAHSSEVLLDDGPTVQKFMAAEVSMYRGLIEKNGLSTGQ